jgi:hypothetical protein
MFTEGDGNEKRGALGRMHGSEVAQLGLENTTPTKLWESCGDEHLELHFIIYIYILRFWLRSCYPLSIL